MKRLLILLNKILSFPFILLILIYRKFISPMTPNSCRYYPSCSSYSLQSYKKYNIFKATYKSIWRVLRCNPYSDGGVDHP